MYNYIIPHTGQLHTCPGEQRMLLCSVSYTFIQWGILTMNQTLRQTTIVPYLGQNLISILTLTNSTTFIFSRNSSPGTLPLVSTMTIKNVTSSLEGTVISFTGINSSSIPSVVLMTTIHVFDIN